MRLRIQLSFLLLLLAAIPLQAHAGVITGNGTARVIQTTEDGAELDEVVNVVAAFSNGLALNPGHQVIRLQFIRPDSRAVAHAVFAFPDPGIGGTVNVGAAETSLLYYELRPGDETKLFQAGEASGELTIEGRPELGDVEPMATFKFQVIGPGEDGDMGTADDQSRDVFSGEVIFFANGDLSGIHYYYDDSDDIYVGGDVFLVYDDGCTGSPDSYDDDYGYDSGDSDDSYSGDSCDGDVYDDDYDDSYDDSYSDDYDDGSCDSDWDDDSSDYDSGDSDWDWGGGDSDSDWGGDTYDQQGRVLKSMSWLQRPPHWLMRELRRSQRLLPMLLAVGLLLALRIRGTRRKRRESQGFARNE
jgi:hypothetical protein